MLWARSAGPTMVPRPFSRSALEGHHPQRQRSLRDHPGTGGLVLWCAAAQLLFFRRLADVSHCLSKVTPSELAARSGLQIALELNRWRFLVELDADEHSPWAVSSGVRRQACVVCVESALCIGRYANVVFVGFANALQDVDEPLRGWHPAFATKR